MIECTFATKGDHEQALVKVEKEKKEKKDKSKAKKQKKVSCHGFSLEGISLEAWVFQT